MALAAALEERIERLDEEVTRILALITSLQPPMHRDDLYVSRATIEEVVERELRAL